LLYSFIERGCYGQGDGKATIQRLYVLVILKYNTNIWTPKKTGKIHPADVNFFSGAEGKQELFEVKMTEL
jgi:hypothetical protein